ncbi:hypothetical protein EMIHUDRAFT_351637 [Emiliania huxleyi CCMP1516]|uniref:Uncharacterized protein n=2 Tax=Emiliania huxleyi TaxID=2903 RepID=A0A0D3KQL6_EMIH1|nr:hypothetical protein EMIHUDRAFT_351637 [Emiliania huxleyi CCMP1516]EOD38051.1 hypothetical protein EMIHUDRAFT_351637 [Emiliania huxleyi CCMP1516]|eukprot:XP_005790480.1 hypothetical protein EMIHUDRAFT_351637 [Emiliania huxleyi CCMP1516]
MSKTKGQGDAKMTPRGKHISNVDDAYEALKSGGNRDLVGESLAEMQRRSADDMGRAKVLLDMVDRSRGRPGGPLERATKAKEQPRKYSERQIAEWRARVEALCCPAPGFVMKCSLTGTLPWLGKLKEESDIPPRGGGVTRTHAFFTEAGGGEGPLDDEEWYDMDPDRGHTLRRNARAQGVVLPEGHRGKRQAPSEGGSFKLDFEKAPRTAARPAHDVHRVSAAEEEEEEFGDLPAMDPALKAEVVVWLAEREEARQPDGTLQRRSSHAGLAHELEGAEFEPRMGETLKARGDMLKWLMEREGVVPPDSERDSYAALEASRHFAEIHAKTGGFQLDLDKGKSLQKGTMGSINTEDAPPPPPNRATTSIFFAERACAAARAAVYGKGPHAKDQDPPESNPASARDSSYSADDGGGVNAVGEVPVPPLERHVLLQLAPFPPPPPTG